ncbi:MAG: nitronate monooxygenase [Bacteroidetes bacterium]|nr:nitronate monooxygenase [Bacteroidota bacterium]
MNWKNRLTDILGIPYPIIQAPMYGVTTPQMVAAANAAGCLGSLPLADMPAAQCAALIRKTRAITGQSFVVNIFTHQLPVVTPELRSQYEMVKTYLEQLSAKNGIDVLLPGFDDLQVNGYKEQVEAIIEEGCKILSFTFGNLDDDSIRLLKENEVLLIGTCTSVEEALVLERSGIDIICVQGIEAGGHQGRFIDDNVPLRGGFSLLPQVFDAVAVPLIYAGGIYNGRTLQAAKTLGAAAYQVGSLLIASEESLLQDFEKQKLEALDESQIVLTKSFSGRYARGIRNTFINAIEDTGYILPYPYQNKITGALRAAAKKAGNAEFTNIWVGQSVYDFSTSSTTDILKTLIADAEQENT